MMVKKALESQPLMLKGKELVDLMKIDQLLKIKEINERGTVPSLLVFVDLEHPPSKLYVNRKIDYCRSLGIEAEIVDISKMTTFQASYRLLSSSFNNLILVQLPLPERHANLEKQIPQIQDIEGFASNHLGNLVSGNLNVYPCTAAAIMGLLQHYKFEFKGARVCIINDSLVVGKPLALAMSWHNATPIICNKYTRDLPEITRISDLIVTAVGKPNFSLNADMIQEGAWVVDAGCRLSEQGKAIGDLEPEARFKCGAYTPTVGGVGPVTVSQVVSNMLKLKS